MAIQVFDGDGVLHDWSKNQPDRTKRWLFSLQPEGWRRDHYTISCTYSHMLAATVEKNRLDRDFKVARDVFVTMHCPEGVAFFSGHLIGVDAERQLLKLHFGYGLERVNQ